MAAPRGSFDWRVPAIWAVVLTASLFVHAYVEIVNEAHSGRSLGLDRALMLEGTSHLAIVAFLPALYWLHRRWRLSGGPRNVMIHAAAVVPFSIVHILGMTALRLLWFVAILGERYVFPLTADRLAYEFSKDIFSYGALSAGVVAIQYLVGRSWIPAPPVAVPRAGAPLERFTVRKRGGTEVVVEVADIDWIEAAGNYAILHVGGATFEIRSSLTRLEGELDAKRFVRVHKSHVVNIARVSEVTPWIGGDWRIRMQDGAEVNLSRRYRSRFEALAPVRS